DIGPDILRIVGKAQRAPYAFGNFGFGGGIVGVPRQRTAVFTPRYASFTGNVRRKPSMASVGRHMRQQSILAGARVVVRALSLAPNTGNGAAAGHIVDQQYGEHADLCVFAANVQI